LIPIARQKILFSGYHNQGDQIGRIFAYWSIVYFGQRLKHYRSSAKFLATFFPRYVLILTKKWFGYILGDFFTNSSGHNDLSAKNQLNQYHTVQNAAG
jgi:hypothetical protein